MQLCKLLPKQGMGSIGVVPQAALKCFPGKTRGERCEGCTGIKHATDINAKTRSHQSALTTMQRLHTHTRERVSNLMIA